MICRFAAVSILCVFMSASVLAQSPIPDAQSAKLLALLQSQSDWTNLIANEVRKATGTSVIPTSTGSGQGINQQTIDSSCQTVIVPPTQQGTLSVGNAADNDQVQMPLFKVTISGPTCPIQLTANMTGAQEKMNFSAQYVVDVTITDPNYLKTSDVNQLHLEMDITASLVQRQAGGVEVQMNLAMTGQANSQANGVIKQKATISEVTDIGAPTPGPDGIPQIAMTMDEDMNYQFPAFAVDLNSVMSMNGLLATPSVTDKINGVAVSADVFQKYMASMNLLVGNQTGSQQPTSPVSNNMICEVQVYDANVVSKQALLTSISSGQPVTAASLLDQITPVSGSWEIHPAQDNVLAALDDESQYMQLAVSVTDKNLTGEVTVLPGEAGAQADQVGDYTFILSCHPSLAEQ